MEQTTNPVSQSSQEEEIKANPSEILKDLPKDPEELQKK